jgi:hypothetical protein
VVLRDVQVVEVEALALDVRADRDIEAEANERLGQAPAGLRQGVQAAGGRAQGRHGQVDDALEVPVAGLGP